MQRSGFDSVVDGDGCGGGGGRLRRLVEDGWDVERENGGVAHDVLT